jgi:hypothetical protein
MLQPNVLRCQVTKLWNIGDILCLKYRLFPVMSKYDIVADFLLRHTTPLSRETPRLLREAVLSLQWTPPRRGPLHLRRPATPSRQCRGNIWMSQVGFQPVSGHGLDPSSNIKVEVLREPLDHLIGAFVERGKGFFSPLHGHRQKYPLG